jgi:hypothetical protein
MHWTIQSVSLVGATFIVGAYVALQRKWWTRHGTAYLVFNLIGSLLLLLVAIVDRRLGFIVLEVVWAAVSADSLVRRRSRAT